MGLQIAVQIAVLIVSVRGLTGGVFRLRVACREAEAGGGIGSLAVADLGGGWWVAGGGW